MKSRSEILNELERAEANLQRLRDAGADGATTAMSLSFAKVETLKWVLGPPEPPAPHVFTEDDLEAVNAALGRDAFKRLNDLDIARLERFETALAAGDIQLHHDGWLGFTMDTAEGWTNVGFNPDPSPPVIALNEAGHVIIERDGIRPDGTRWGAVVHNVHGVAIVESDDGLDRFLISYTVVEPSHAFSVAVTYVGQGRPIQAEVAYLNPADRPAIARAINEMIGTMRSI